MLLFLFVIIFRGSSAPSDMTGLTLYRGHVGTFMIKRHKLQICHHFIFVFSLYFFYHSCCRIKAGSVSTVKSFNFKVWYWRLYWSRSTKDPVDSHHWFVVEVLPSLVFRNLNPQRARNSHLGLCHTVSQTGLFLDAVSSFFERNGSKAQFYQERMRIILSWFYLLSTSGFSGVEKISLVYSTGKSLHRLSTTI